MKSKPKKPPDPSQLHLLRSSLLSSQSFALSCTSLSLSPESYVVIEILFGIDSIEIVPDFVLVRPMHPDLATLVLISTPICCFTLLNRDLIQLRGPLSGLNFVEIIFFPLPIYQLQAYQWGTMMVGYNCCWLSWSRHQISSFKVAHGLMTQFAQLGRLVRLVSMYASISGRLSRPLSPKVRGDLACYGYGRTLSPPSVSVVWTTVPGSANGTHQAPDRLAGVRTDDCLVALLFPLQRDSSCCTIHTRPEWTLPTVSFHCRLLVFRSGFQVCFLSLYLSTLRAIYCLCCYLKERSLLTIMNQFEARSISSNASLCCCGKLIKQLYSLDNISQLLSPPCVALPVDLSLAPWLALHLINVYLVLNPDKDVIGCWMNCFGFPKCCVTTYFPCVGLVSRSGQLDSIKRVSSFGPLWQFNLPASSCLCILRRMVVGLCRLSWLWLSLWLFCPSGAESMEIVVICFACLFCETDLLCPLLLINLAHPMTLILDILRPMLPCSITLGGCKLSGYHCCRVICSVGGEDYVRSYAMYSIAFPSPRNNLPLRWLFLALRGPNLGSILILLLDMILVQRFQLFCLMSTSCYLVCCLFLSGILAIPISLILIGCVHRVPLYHTSPTSLFHRGCTFCMAMSNGVVIINLVAWLRKVHNIFVHGSACIIAEILVSIFALHLSWAFSYPLLSLSRACKHAQEHVTLYTCCCWHLDNLPRLRDEVKEECPIVYEDNLSETKSFGLMLSLVPFYWCYISGQQQIPNIYDLKIEMRNTLKDLAEDNHGNWAATGIYISHCVEDKRPESSNTAYDGTLSTRSNLMIQGPSMLIIQFHMYCFLMTVLARLQCLKLDIVLFTSRCIIPLEKSCNHCIFSKFDQHLSVLGPCLMALAQHLRMLRKVYYGVYDSYDLILASVGVVATPKLRLQLFRL